MDNFISIIIPIFNLAPYIEKCIDSLRNQGIPEFEIILINDGSTDGSGDICDRLAEKDKRIKVIHMSNGGVNTARNTGLKAAKGKWITFVDGDDYLEPNTFLLMFQELNNTPDADLIQFPEIKKIDNTIILCNDYPPLKHVIDSNEKKAYALLKRKPWIHSFLWGKIYKRDIWEGLHLREDIFYSEDKYHLPELLERSNKIIISPLGGYYHVARPNSAVNTPLTPSKYLDLSRTEINLLKYSLKYNIRTGWWWNSTTQLVIDAWHLNKHQSELEDYFEYLQNSKRLIKKNVPDRKILKIAHLLTPKFAANLNNFILIIKENLGKRKK